MRGDGHGRRSITVPATYQSDERPHVRLTGLDVDYVGAASSFQWPRGALAKAGIEDKTRREQLEVRLTLRGNAEAVRRLSAFFGLYGEDEEFRRAGFLPTTPEVMALPPGDEMIGEVVEPGDEAGEGGESDDW